MQSEELGSGVRFMIDGSAMGLRDVKTPIGLYGHDDCSKICLQEHNVSVAASSATSQGLAL